MKKTLLALALIGASATASADSWIYGGANVGQSDFGSEDATSYGVHVGTGILPLIGLEAGYQTTANSISLVKLQRLKLTQFTLRLSQVSTLVLCTYTQKAVCTSGI